MSKIKKTQSKFYKYHFSKIQIIFLALLLTIGSVSAWVFHELFFTKVADDWFESSVTKDNFVSLPRDDAPHDAAMEWWYYNGHLNTETGKEYSFHFTVFLVNNIVHHMVSHVSINDYQTNKHITAQRRTAGNPSNNKDNGFEFSQGDWSMVGTNGNDKLKVDVEEYSLDLNLTNARLPVVHGGNGIIALKNAGNSYYYSRTRMAISGIIKIGNITEKVTGISWFDHQWGDFSVNQLSWEWFSLQLDDDTDLMIYQLRDRKTDEPVLYTGSINRNGVNENLTSADFNVVPGKKWVSNKSNIAYPIEWTIDIPTRNINLVVRSVNESNEFDAMLTTFNIYWEGAVKVRGSHTGRGFMELYNMDKKS